MGPPTPQTFPLPLSSSNGQGVSLLTTPGNYIECAEGAEEMEKLSDLQPGDLTCAAVAPCIPYCVGRGLWVCVTSEEDGTAVGVRLHPGQKVVGALSLGEVKAAGVVVARAQELGLGQLLRAAPWGGSPFCAQP